MQRREKLQKDGTQVICKEHQLTRLVGVQGRAARALLQASKAARKCENLRQSDTIAYFVEDGHLIACRNSRLRGAANRRGIATVEQIKQWLDSVSQKSHGPDAQPIVAVA